MGVEDRALAGRVRGRGSRKGGTRCLLSVGPDGRPRAQLASGVDPMGALVFVSYAHEDRDKKQELVGHLRPLEREGLIEIAEDERFLPGTQWREAIEDLVSRTDVFLILISHNYVQSEFCYEVELEAATRQVQAGKATLIPVVLSEVDWTHLPIAGFNALPTGGRAVDSFANLDNALKQVAEGVRRVLETTGSEGAETPRDLQACTPLRAQVPHASDAVTGTGQVELTLVLDRHIDEYSERDKRQLLDGISKLLGVTGGIRIVNVEEGSVRVRLELPAALAERLQWLIESGQLADLGVRESILHGASQQADLLRGVVGGDVVPRTPVASGGHETPSDAADNSLFGELYEELHALAQSYMSRRAPGDPLRPTALVGEAYLKLFRSDASRWTSKAHFMAVAARAMRSMLVDYARGKGRRKRKAQGRRVGLEGLVSVFERDLDIEHLDAGLKEMERGGHERAVRVAELRFFCGLTMSQIAHTQDCSLLTVKRDWQFSIAWLRCWFE